MKNRTRYAPAALGQQAQFGRMRRFLSDLKRLVRELFRGTTMTDTDHDQLLDCIDCSSTFTLSIGAARWHAERFGAGARPKRCPRCRRLKKARFNGGPTSNDWRRDELR